MPEYPAGMTSSTATPVASSGPSLDTVIVNVTVSPTFGDGSDTALTSDRSATCGTTTALSSSSSDWSPSSFPGAESGSTVSTAVTSATFRYSSTAPVGASTTASNERSTEPPLVITKPLQVIVEPTSTPPAEMPPTPLNPAGMTSSTATPVASSGPALDTVMVNVTESPTLGVRSSTAFIKERSATRGVTVALSSSSSD